MKKNNKQKKEKNTLSKKNQKEWTVQDTMRLYPLLSEEEAKMAWEMGW